MEDKSTSFFNYCPNCGTQNGSYVNNFKFECHDCNFVLYHNIAAAVAIIFTFKDKLLFTVRNVAPDKGTLDLPGGFIDPNETAKEAACREIKEELGIDILPENLKYCTTSPNNYLYKNVAYRTLDIFYEYELENDTTRINAKDEIKDLLWIKRDEIDLSKIGFVSVRKVIGEKFIK